MKVYGDFIVFFVSEPINQDIVGRQPVSVGLG